jgi:hypothetical protein
MGSLARQFDAKTQAVPKAARPARGGFLKALDLEKALAAEPTPTIPYVDLEPNLSTALSVRLQEASADPGRITRDWGKILKACTPTDLAAVLRFDARRYTRRRIAFTPTAEVLLMCWLPGHATLIHDHGDIHARVFLLSGEAQETEFAHRGQSARVLGRTKLRAGDEFRERPGSVHRVAAVGRGPLITLHLNSPPLTVMHSYDEVASAHR